MEHQLLFFSRVAIATISMGVAYVALLSLLFGVFKFGLYGETEVPLGELDPAHRRARRCFFFCASVVEVATLLTGYGINQLYPAEWMNFTMPLLVGSSFSMLYAACTRYDRMRPPQRS
jgi:hypothetical protein